MISAVKNIADSLFECTMCGQCCKGYGGTYITCEDSEKIVAFLGITHNEFVLKYEKILGDRILLVQQKNGYCIFWDQNKACLIHPVKPDMCKNWPFIHPVLNDINNWKIMAGLCPGIKVYAEDAHVTAYIKSYINHKLTPK